MTRRIKKDDQKSKKTLKDYGSAVNNAEYRNYLIKLGYPSLAAILEDRGNARSAKK